jgi:hypothetical protein
MIDEIPGANSIESMKEDLKMRQDGTSKISDILEFTKTSDLNSANAVINDKYRDLDTEIIALDQTAILNIRKRPSLFEYAETPENDLSQVDSAIFITSSLDKMARTMGINIKHMSRATMR